MATQDQTYMIDPEFGFAGPMAFDIAKIMGEVLLTVFATYGQEATQPDKPRGAQRGECAGGKGVWDVCVGGGEGEGAVE